MITTERAPHLVCTWSLHTTCVTFTACFEFSLKSSLKWRFKKKKKKKTDPFTRCSGDWPCCLTSAGTRSVLRALKQDYSNALGICSVDRQPMKRKRAALECAWQTRKDDQNNRSVYKLPMLMLSHIWQVAQMS